jgi:protein-serine/threonine kinase
MDGNNNNRLHLNFDNNSGRLNDRAYPTTPSTFPQPVFPPPGGQQSGGLQPHQQQYAPQYAPQGYFAGGQNHYQQQQAYQPHAVNDYSHAQNAAYQPRSNTPGTNDPNAGLAHQFAHQNLGGAGRNAGYARGPSPSQRPRTAGGSAQQQPAYGSYATPPVPVPAQPAVGEFQAAPERNPDKYGSNANSNQKKCSQLAADFFKDSVKRARERNQRYAFGSGVYLSL